MDKLTEAIERHESPESIGNYQYQKDHEVFYKATCALQKIVEAMPKNPYMDQRAFESVVYSSTMKILRDGGYIE